MINNFKKTAVVVLAILFTRINSFAQNVQAPVEMADELRQSGKIYVVVAVLSIIFIGIIAYLIRLELKLKNIEKELKNK